MNERIKLVRKMFGLTQKKMGEILGITEGAVSNIENGNRNVTPQMQKAICREFNVNYLWLTEGIGEMFIGKEEKEKIERMLDDAYSKGENSIQFRVLVTLAQLDESDWKSLEKIIDAINKGM